MKVAEWISVRAGEYSKLAEVATKRDIFDASTMWRAL